MYQKSAHNGKLLDSVSYALRRPSKSYDICGNEITVQDAFPFNPSSKTSPETAKRWARENSYTYDITTGKYVYDLKEWTPEIVTIKNIPFKVQITDLSVRSEGGRAYKVIDEKNRQFDLREDQILEIFRHVGVRSQGFVNGTFVWGMLGSQMHMVLVGGNMYEKMLENTQKSNELKEKQATNQTISASKAMKDTLYMKSDGSHVAFLGRVSSPHHEKTLYAFFDMGNDKGDHKWYLKSDYMNENWVKLTFIERLTYLLMRPYTQQITLLASFPKNIVSPISSLDLSLLRNNDQMKLSYFNGAGEDLAEKFATTERPRSSSHFYHSKDDTRFKDWQRNSLMDFRDSLIWMEE